MATTVYTDSMKARAEILVSESKTWTRGRRKSDSLAFVIFPSSKPGRAYYSTETACSCPSYYHRLACSHVLAVKTDNERVRAEADRPRKSYDALFPGNDDIF